MNSKRSTELMKKYGSRGFAILVIALMIVLGAACLSVLQGCSALKAVSSAPANETITEVIADAGTVAITAQQMYVAGSIPQTAAVRTAINDLGNAYNAAKSAYQVVLTAEIAYNAAATAQLSACTPPAGALAGATAAACTTATANATSAQTQMSAAQAQLSTQVSALVSKTTAVKAITTPK